MTSIRFDAPAQEVTPAQQDLSHLLHAANDAVLDLRDHAENLRRVGLDKLASELSEAAEQLNAACQPVAARFIKGEI